MSKNVREKSHKNHRHYVSYLSVITLSILIFFQTYTNIYIFIKICIYSNTVLFFFFTYIAVIVGLYIHN